MRCTKNITRYWANAPNAQFGDFNHEFETDDINSKLNSVIRVAVPNIYIDANKFGPIPAKYVHEYLCNKFDEEPLLSYELPTRMVTKESFEITRGYDIYMSEKRGLYLVMYDGNKYLKWGPPTYMSEMNKSKTKHNITLPVLSKYGDVAPLSIIFLSEYFVPYFLNKN